MFKALLVALALCACVSTAFGGRYGSLPSYGSSVSLSGIPVPLEPIYGYPPATAADAVIAQAPWEVKPLLEKALSLKQPQYPLVGGYNPVLLGPSSYGGYAKNNYASGYAM